MGACCIANECFQVATPQECLDQNGVWHGDVLCEIVNCDDFGVGACCQSSFGAQNCLNDINVEDCASIYGGVHAGQGTVCGTPPGLCDAFEGACCVNSALCLDPTMDGGHWNDTSCLGQGGVFHGPLTRCDNVDCLDVDPGACCMPDDSCVDDTLPSYCNDVLEGIWAGVFTFCTGPGHVDCGDGPQPATGSCCLLSGGCIDGLTNEECTNEPGGQFRQGIPCPQNEGPDCPSTGCRTLRYGAEDGEYQIGDKTKSLNLCETAVGIFAVKAHDAQDSEVDKFGHLSPFTNHEVRAFFNADPRLDCLPSYGEFAINVFGFLEPTICSKPGPSNTSRRLNVGAFIVAPEGMESEDIPAGHLHMVLPIDNPVWTEVQYHHSPRLCGGPLVEGDDG